jgi:HAD superfamily hydrolase (TIGR01549 family)
MEEAEIAKPDGMLFDLGGTLLREDSFDPVAGQERLMPLARNPRGLSPQEILERVRAIDRDLGDRRESSWQEVPSYSVQRLVYEPNDITFELSFAELELEFWKGATRMSPTESVQDLLEAMCDAGVPLGVVSNSTFSGATLEWQIGQFDLRRYFRFVMSSADYVVRKPHPLLFETAARKLGTAPERTWYVGDSRRYDVSGARAAGLFSVLYGSGLAADPPEFADVRADLEIASWSELQAIIAGWQQSS